MALSDYARTIDGFDTWSHAEKIRFFAWFLHSKSGMTDFASSDIKACFAELSVGTPSSISAFLGEMAAAGSVLRSKTSGGTRFRLERATRARLESSFGEREASILVTKLLTDLPPKISSQAERQFLEETLLCFRAGAYRAALVMAWNLAYDHLCSWILASHLVAFNSAIPRRYPKNGKQVSKRDDLTDFKEIEVIEIANTAGLTANSHKVLDEKLKKRNMAAHPSGLVISQLQAEEAIHDLVTNVVLKLV
jgi:hypothetical protein